jgi:hypothetical protein
MDKFYYYVLQADRMLPKWLKDAEEHSKHLMSSNVSRAIQSAGLGSASQSELSETDDSNNYSEYDTNSVGADDAEDSDENSKGDYGEIDDDEQELW